MNSGIGSIIATLEAEDAKIRNQLQTMATENFGANSHADTLKNIYLSGRDKTDTGTAEMLAL